jgi:hypothetical protein
MLALAGCGGSSPSSTSTDGDTDGGTAKDANELPPSSDATVLRDAGPGEAGSQPTIAMSRISAHAPAFSSGNANSSTGPSNANDDNNTTSWVPDTLPAWIAYDLSGAPMSERQNILVVWNAEHSWAYLNASTPAGAMMPTDYTIEVNAAPGGTSAPPADGWTVVARVSGNLRNTVQSLATLGGGNWVRVSITGATDPQVAIDLDVFSAPSGATDSWMLMGDSVTYMAMGYAFSDLPQLVHQARFDRWPAVVNAAIGGTNTNTALTVIDDTMNGFPGRYVGLAYGTNDHPSTFAMEALVEKVIAAGKVPVVPHIPWQDDPTLDADIAQMNTAIDALYAKYPQVLPGPDLWTTFMNHPELYPDAGGPHPNADGAEVQRKAWAATMAAVP